MNYDKLIDGLFNLLWIIVTFFTTPIAALIYTVPVWLCWNYVAPVFGVPPLTLVQTFALMLISHLILPHRYVVMKDYPTK